MTNDYKQLSEELYKVLNRFRSWSPEIDDVISKYEEATTRGTGRTTALYMKAITEALENPGKSVEFIDHHPHRWDSALYHADKLRDIIKKLGYDIVVTVEKNRVFLYNRFGQ
jgi:molybdopterin-guanine dinucleotide biosynthesis protein